MEISRGYETGRTTTATKYIINIVSIDIMVLFLSFPLQYSYIKNCIRIRSGIENLINQPRLSFYILCASPPMKVSVRFFGIGRPNQLLYPTLKGLIFMFPFRSNQNWQSWNANGTNFMRTRFYGYIFTPVLNRTNTIYRYIYYI